MHEYLRRIEQAVRRGVIEEMDVPVLDMDIFHDDSCALYSGGECNCDPSIVVTTENGSSAILADGTLQRLTG